MTSSNRPNIIFIQSDSMDGRAMGCMGHPSMGRATPNLDRLADKGVLFRQAYCNSPICCPSRASMWSGLYTHHCEGWNNYKGLSESDPTFMDQLVSAGYRTKILGGADYLSGHHSIRARVSPWTRSAKIMKSNYRMDGPKVFESDSVRVHLGDWRISDEAVEWLKENAEGVEPFFLYLTVGVPHPPFTTSQYHLDLIDEASIALPPWDENSHPALEYQRINKNWMHGFSDETVRLVRRIYFAMISEADALAGQLLETVEHTGVADSTYIIFTSDHGELAMEHRQFYKMSPYEPSVRVPLIVSGPGVKEGSRVDTPVSLVDIYPTLMDMARQPHPRGLDGYSLMPELIGEPTEHPGWALSEFHDSTCPTGAFMLREGDWKYIVYVGYKPQLFNLKDDPWEINDLTRKLPGKVKEMDDLLRQVVDYEAVDGKVKAYDKASFREWREERLAAGDYYELMSRIFSGWDGLTEDDVEPWTKEDECLIESWLQS